MDLLDIGNFIEYLKLIVFYIKKIMLFIFFFIFKRRYYLYMLVEFKMLFVRRLDIKKFCKIIDEIKDIFKKD